MEDFARGVLTGVAIGGFAAVVVKVNMFTIDKLSMLNNLAIETAVGMARTTLENIEMRRQRRHIAKEQKRAAYEAKLEGVIREAYKRADAESESAANARMESMSINSEFERRAEAESES